MVNRCVKQLVFHTPDTYALLRGHRPERFGDYLGEIRSTVAAVNREHSVVRGFEEGRTFNGFRNVFPLVLDDTYVGAVEVSYSAAFVVREMDSVYHGRYLFLIDRRVVEHKVHPDETENYTDSPISPRFLQESNRFTELLAVDQSMDEDQIDALHRALPASFVTALESFTAEPILVEAAGDSIAVLPLVIRNYVNEPVAYILSYEPLPGIKSVLRIHRRDSLFRNAGLAVLAATIVLVLHYWAVARRRSRRLSQLVREREYLIRDTLHRTKNNMNVIRSLLSLQASRIADPSNDEFFEELDDRIDVFSQVQEMLYRSTDLQSIDLSEYFPRIVGTTVQGATTDTVVSVQFAVDPSPVPARLATLLGLIVSELATNSMKYAFSHRTNGVIQIGTSRGTAPGKEFLELSICDDGVGISREAQQNDGFGTDLVRSIVTDQLHGTISVSDDAGTCWRIVVPVNRRGS